MGRAQGAGSVRHRCSFTLIMVAMTTMMFLLMTMTMISKPMTIISNNISRSLGWPTANDGNKHSDRKVAPASASTSASAVGDCRATGCRDY